MFLESLCGTVYFDGRPAEPFDAWWHSTNPTDDHTQLVSPSCILGSPPPPVGYLGNHHEWSIAAVARLDYPEDLRARLQSKATWTIANHDAALAAAAFCLEKQAALDILNGDWALAAWHKSRRELVLARDRLGTQSIFIARQPNAISFASSLPVLLRAPHSGRSANLGQVARLLTLDPEFDEDGGTLFAGIDKVPPSHSLTATPDRSTMRRYWSMVTREATHYRSQVEVDEAVRGALTQAVSRRIDHAPIGCTLSGGLDSSSICDTAARLLAPAGRSLTALTAVLRHPVSWGNRPDAMLDEWELAASVASSHLNINHQAIPAVALSPVGGLRRDLAIQGQPSNTSTNVFWIYELIDAAARSGVRTLLTGQAGNAALSWRGPRPVNWYSRSRRVLQIAASASLGVDAIARVRLRRYWHDWQLGSSPWRWHSAIQPSFAAEQRIPSEPRSRRLALTGNTIESRGRLFERKSRRGSVFWRTAGAAFGVSVRDPTLDVQLLERVISLPAWAWNGDMDRWVLRSSMAGRLPDGVRLNPRTGVQSADLIERLRDCRDELFDALAEASRSGLAQHCVDLDYCRMIATRVMDAPPDPFVRWTANAILMRGLGVALFLAAIDRPR